MLAGEGCLLRDMSRKRKAKGCRACELCGIPFAFFNESAKFCSSRCRQRFHRGHRSLDTIRRVARGFFNGHLSDRIDADYSN
jgi:protein-arginine kinase activator protein McsA